MQVTQEQTTEHRAGQTEQKVLSLFVVIICLYVYITLDF